MTSVLNATPDSQIQMSSRQLSTKKRKTLVLDLDETLIHSTIKGNETGFDFQVDVDIDGAMYTFYIFKRPHVNYFLEKVFDPSSNSCYESYSIYNLSFGPDKQTNKLRSVNGSIW